MARAFNFQDGKVCACMVIALVQSPLCMACLSRCSKPACSCHCQVREYHAPTEGSELTTAQAEQLKKDVEQKKNALEQWCKTAYGEVGGAGEGSLGRVWWCSST